MTFQDTRTTDTFEVAPAADPNRMDSRTWTMLFSGVAAILLFALATMLPLPYALMKPGPVRDVLGEAGGTPLISIEGRETYPTSGSLDLLTVRVTGGPGSATTLWDVLGGWVDSTVAVRPVDEVFPPDVSEADIEAENAAEMVTSQETATAAALGELDIAVPTTLTVAGFAENAPADGQLEADDVITSVDGVEITDLPQLRDALQEANPGQQVAVGVTRDGEEQTIDVTTLGDGKGRTILGVFVDPTYTFPFDVKIAIEDIGGPSAGMMFALGIVDKLTPGEMTGGENVAGTGTIDSDGSVGPIGGIQQKLVGASDAGADWFLAPSDNCNEVTGHVPDGLQVIEVSTLAEARDAVEAIGTGDQAALDAMPSCRG